MWPRVCLTQSGPVIKSCKLVEPSRSRIPSFPSILPTLLEHINDTTRYQGYFFTEPKMGWPRYFKNIFRGFFCFMFIHLVKIEPPRKKLPSLQTCGIESSLNAVATRPYKVMVMNLMT